MTNLLHILPLLLLLLLFSSLSTLSTLAMATTPPHQNPYNPFSLETPSQLVDLAYHMGPVVAASPTNLYLIWYGRWDAPSQSIIRDFLLSLSDADGKNSSSPPPAVASPSVADWWRSTACLYTDQTSANITSGFTLAQEYRDAAYSHGTSLSRLSVQSVIRSAVTGYPERLPLDPYNGLYLVLTSPDVRVEDFCREVCGFHYFTFSAIVGVTVPFAWVGHSGVQCPGMCAFPFALPEYIGGGERNGTAASNNLRALGVPNGDVGVDGMISVIGHELAEMASNPLINAWYVGDDPAAPTEIADLCVGVYGTGGGGGYVGSVYKGEQGEGYNLNGVNGRRFLVQWLWNPVRKSCFGPNALN
ncbi:protein EXORDIUM-like 7 [Ananas comosus]|uniref:Protein EXORDIUM-like 7 n=1 Tax=Ananas comosus TaxID=4615 RepID=A0A6P5FJA8_ANACO|nr:protein EXORDIUM-like 7 [Ananas comosus]